MSTAIQRPTADDPETKRLAELAASLFDAEAQAAASSPPRRPVSTCRLQLYKKFRFADADAIVGYLDALGVTDLYLSPYLMARPGSTHGYDVIDHSRINPEVGDETDHDRLLSHLAERGMGRVLDIVPNHMGFALTNPFLIDVLENGPQARWASFFDIDWSPVKDALEGRVLLPILGDFYGAALESGQLVLERDGGTFWIRNYDMALPVRPHSYALILGRRAAEFQETFHADGEDVLEYLSLRDACERLPKCRFCPPEEVDHVRREKEVIKRRLAHLCQTSHRLKEFLDDNVASFQGVAGDPRSFDALHALLEDQVYRLAYWRVAAEEINYRRFFDVTDLAGIRVEDPDVFDHVHRLILSWVEDGGISGLRLDHPDGLADPLGYYQRLQEQCFVSACHRRFEDGQGDPQDWSRIAPRIAEMFRAAASEGAASPLWRRFPVVAEKILSTGEKLPSDWPIDGTVGYEFLNAVNGLFVNPEASAAVESTYREFTGDTVPFAEMLHESKLLIERAMLASELNTLAQSLSRVAESNRRTRDFTLNDLRRALIEVVACFRVYRTYTRPGEAVTARDKTQIDTAVARARRRLPTVDRLVFDFIREVLSLELPANSSGDERAIWERFVVRFQQTTGPVQAKGLEDTTFYRQFPLLSLNEVGGDPSRWATSPSSFHALNAHRLAEWPGGFSTTATHDTKRGEDARIRINVISETHDDWKTRLARWSRWNSRKKSVVNEAPCPDANEEYLLYQTLLGAWPVEAPDLASESPPPREFVERVQGFMLKAVCEAKRNTTWTDPDPTYKEKLSAFVEEILDGPDAGPFLSDFRVYQRKVARVGFVHSLAQTLLKLASPGPADVYQGCELWDFSMVDPDNRRPVDFTARAAMLDEAKRRVEAPGSRAALARELWNSPEDGAIKQFLVWTGFSHRRANPALYLQGGYRPFEAAGALRDNVVAFGRTHQGQQVLAVAPRLVASLMGDDASVAPVGAVWKDTQIPLPDTAPSRWRNLLTDEIILATGGDSPRSPRLSDIFATIPLALLVEEPATSPGA